MSGTSRTNEMKPIIRNFAPGERRLATKLPRGMAEGSGPTAGGGSLFVSCTILKSS
ncbi:hypothetical protein AGR9A_Cc120401 [Agrobacterium salinitolerans str. Hayward 0363]|nr:hypothetical protein AGR9A_Cc120401 [Agrobacterium salinitolerans str. Hayward 0363]